MAIATVASAISHPFCRVAEPERERELLKSCVFPENFIYNNTGVGIDPQKLSASSDTVLTALAQLATHRTGASRAIISIFDQEYQYIIAESTSTLPLKVNATREQTDEDLWLCGTAIPRAHSVCEYTLLFQHPEHFETADDGLPFLLVKDLSVDPRFCNIPYCQPGSPISFYASVPLRTARGINIGVLCVLDAEPISTWSHSQTDALRDISGTIMEYLVSKRAQQRAEQTTRVVTSFSQFIETTEGGSSFEGRMDPKQDDAEAHDCRHSTTRDHKKGASEHALDGEATNNHQLFDTAARIIKEELGLDGCIFLDPKPQLFRSLDGALSHDDTDTSSDDATCFATAELHKGIYEHDDNDESLNGFQSQRENVGTKSPMCSIWSSAIPLNWRTGRGYMPRIAPKFLASLLKKYPKGKVYHFDRDGDLRPTLTSDEDEQSKKLSVVEDSDVSRRTKTKTRKREIEGKLIHRLLPNARSVIFLPIWDPKREIWLAGGFAYTEWSLKPPTSDPCQAPASHISMGRPELQFLRAFGMVVASKYLMDETTSAHKANLDALGGLSHELRSPLHGIILCAELLNSTNLNNSQAEACQILDKCCRTLKDTFDHLLDYAKINHVITDSKRQKHLMYPRGLRKLAEKTIEAGMINPKSMIHLGSLVEEVLDCVLVGSGSSQPKERLTDVFKTHSGSTVTVTVADDSSRKSSSSIEQIPSPKPGLKTRVPEVSPDQHVWIFLIPEQSSSLDFYAETGALRRLVMNVFGNSVKFTQSGHILVRLNQSDISQRNQALRGVIPPTRTAKPTLLRRQVSISITDTGKGMTEDYLQWKLFQPFSKEDVLAPGTGLGLNLVQQILLSLGGRIRVKSSTKSGTTVSMTVPLESSTELNKSVGSSMVHSSGAQHPPTLNTQESDRVGDCACLPALEAEPTSLSGYCVSIFNGDVEQEECSSEGKRAFAFSPGAEKTLYQICEDELDSDVLDISESAARPWSAKTPHVILVPEPLLAIWQDHALANSYPTVIISPRMGLHQPPIWHQVASTNQVVFNPITPAKLSRAIKFSQQSWCSKSTSTTDACKAPVEEQDFSPPPMLPFGLPTPSSLPSQCSLSPRIGPSVITPPGDDQDEKTLGTLSTPDDTDVRLSPARPPLMRKSTAYADAEFLIVDDNTINRKVLSAFMNKMSQKHRQASNGLEALTAYKDKPSALCCVFMDISMPVMDGLEATRAIRAFESEQSLPPALIIAMTGLASQTIQESALTSGVDLLLTKPVSFKELEAILVSRGVLKAVSHTSIVEQ